MAEYWRRPEQTAETLKNGWLHTGDIARVDEDGFTSIVQRKKDLIIVDGFNVYPSEIETVLYTHPAVRLAAVMMGVWFAASAIANYLAGILESLLAGSTIPLYWFLVGSSVGAGVLLLLISPLLVRLMHGWGGVTIAYRRRMIDSPSYTLNHEEVAKALEAKFGEPRKAALTWKPQNTVPVDDETGEKLLKLIDLLNEHDDVQNVYANFEVSDALMAKMGGG